MTYHIVNLFSKRDCFLCKLYEWIESLFVYEEPKKTGVLYGTETSPVEHFTMYHSWFLFFSCLLIGCLIFVIVYMTRKPKTPALRVAGAPKAYEQEKTPTVNITLYGFKNVVLSTDQAYYPDIPSREGYAFTGWFYDPSFTKPFMPGKKLKKDITLYPRWQKE